MNETQRLAHRPELKDTWAQAGEGGLAGQTAAEKFLYKCAEAEDAGKRIKWNVIKNAFSDAVRTETVLKHWMQEV